MDRSIIENYGRGGEKLTASIVGLSREELLAFPVPGTWSIQQIVIHLLDSDLISMDRMDEADHRDGEAVIDGL